MIGDIILMCAGKDQRWNMHLGVHKHLVPVEGENLLDRTLRLIRAHTEASITIVSFDPDYARPHCRRFEPLHGPDNFCDTDKFLGSHELWSDKGQTVILYGDVFFTPAAMATIMGHRGAHWFFGRREGSHYTGCRWGELFALSVPPSERQAIGHALEIVRSALLSGRLPRGGGWELYHHLHGNGWDNFTEIDDFTDDFDFPGDYDRWLRRYNNPLHRRLVPIYNKPLRRAKHLWRRMTH